MAGGKKKKKPAAVNPLRGFATTSIARKTKIEEVPEPEELPHTNEISAPLEKESEATASQTSTAPNLPAENLSPEEFEKQLENSELQALVEKHAQKSKRDALRQKTRLETDRRVLRGQAESLNTRKWLPPELMDEILDVVKAEGRFSGPAVETAGSSKPVSEEELAIRLWTLQQSLHGAGFLEDKILLALHHVLEISDKVGSSNKDAIWGMEECLEWLARECSREELPDYDNPNRKARSQAGS